MNSFNDRRRVRTEVDDFDRDETEEREELESESTGERAIGE